MANNGSGSTKVVLPIHVLLELLSKEDKSMSVKELCARFNVEPKAMFKILDILLRRGLIVLSSNRNHVKLTGIAILYLKDLKEVLTS